MHFLKRVKQNRPYKKRLKFRTSNKSVCYSENIFLPEISVARSLPVWTVASLGQFQPYWLPHFFSEEIIWFLVSQDSPCTCQNSMITSSEEDLSLKHRCFILCQVLRRLFSLGPMTLSQSLFLRPLLDQLGHGHWDLPSLQGLDLAEPRRLKRRS